MCSLKTHLTSNIRKQCILQICVNVCDELPACLLTNDCVCRTSAVVLFTTEAGMNAAWTEVCCEDGDEENLSGRIQDLKLVVSNSPGQCCVLLQVVSVQHLANAARDGCVVCCRIIVISAAEKGAAELCQQVVKSDQSGE
jgi:hypothetical protein